MSVISFEKLQAISSGIYSLSIEVVNPKINITNFTIIIFITNIAEINVL